MTPQAAGGKWRAHLANVVIGLINAKYVEIKSGLNEGDQVVYSGVDTLTEGAPVLPTAWGTSSPAAPPPAARDVPAGTVYTCPMHPEVVQDHPGQCPKCHMELVRKDTNLPAAPEGKSGSMPGMGGMK